MNRLFCYAAIFAQTLLWNQLCAVWKGPVDIFSAQSVQNPVVGVDGKGNAVVHATLSDDLTVFYQEAANIVDGSPENFTTFAPLGFNIGVNAISVTPKGQAAALWTERDGGTTHFFLRSAILNAGWDTPTTISNIPNFTVQVNFPPAINLNTAVEAQAVWTSLKTTDNSYHVEENRYLAGLWGTNADITSSTTLIESTVYDGNTAGVALAAWYKTAPLRLDGAYFDGTSWTVTPSLSTSIFTGADPVLAAAINELNHGIVVFNTPTGLSSISMQSGAFGAANPLYLTQPNETIDSVSVTLDTYDNAIAVFIVSNSSTLETKLMVNRLTSGIWGTPLTFQTVGTGQNILNENIAIDNLGNVYIVWEKDDGINRSIFYNYYTQVTNSWQGSGFLLSEPGVTTTTPHLAMNALGAAYVVWSIGDSGDQKVQAVYTENRRAAPLPPTNLIGFVNSGGCDDHILKWTQSVDGSVVKYRIRRNGHLIGCVEATTESSYLTFTDKCRPSASGCNPTHHHDVYEVTAVNEFCIESAPITITL